MGSNSAYRSLLPIKAVAASAAVLSAVVTLHFAGPSMESFASAEVPKIYDAMVSWLTPPYLYFVINVIIISIAASSRFQKSGSGSAPIAKQEFIVVTPPALVVEEEMKVAYAVPAEYGTAVEDERYEEEVKVAYTVPTEYWTAVEEKKYGEKEKEEEEEEEFVISRSSWTPKRRVTELVTGKAAEKETTEIPTEYPFLTEKPLVSARLGRRKSLKASPEAGRALGVARTKRNDTLESTWKAITDGRAVPLTRHQKKSDTWETDHHAPDPIMRKSETFKERGGGGGGDGVGRRPPTLASPSPLGSSPAARLRKEPSVGQEDLNRRVEAFIKKFNEEMRLQRQESFKYYLDMINRGSH